MNKTKQEIAEELLQEHENLRVNTFVNNIKVNEELGWEYEKIR